MNTKQDYLNMKDTEEGQRALRELLEYRYAWFDTKVILNKEDGIEDTTHRLIPDKDCFIQQEYKEDPRAKIFMIGFTVSEVEALCI